MDPIFPHFSSWMGTLHSLYQSLPLDPSLPLAPCSGWRTLNGPTLADGQRVIVLKHTSIERFDIVVAKEVENGKTKQIVKRIIGMPGDTITYQNDKLTINGKEVKEEYLKEFHAAFAKDKLQKEYAYSDYFQQLAKESKAFTVNADKNTTFSVTVPEGKYFLLGDNRIVSKDSREVGYFDKSALVGEVKFRFWPLDKIGTVEDN